MYSDYLYHYLVDLNYIETFYKTLKNGEPIPTSTDNPLFNSQKLRKYPVIKQYIHDVNNPDFVGLDSETIRDLMQIIGTPDEQETLNFDFGRHIKITKHPRYGITFYHSHSFIELVYVYKGHCPQIINGKEIILQAGDICLMSTQTKHSIQETGDEDLILNILIPLDSPIFNFLESQKKGNFIYSFFINVLYKRNDYNHYFVFRTQNRPEFLTLIEQMVHEYFGENSINVHVSECYLTALLLKLIYLEQPNIESQKSTGSMRTIDPISILNYMHYHMRTVTLAETATYFHYNQRYLSSVIKKMTGKTFSDILRKIRIEESANLLTCTAMSVNDIANQVGYTNMSFFYKAFAKIYHTTPADYRHLNKID